MLRYMHNNTYVFDMLNYMRMYRYVMCICFDILYMFDTSDMSLHHRSVQAVFGMQIEQSLWGRGGGG